MTQLDSVNSFNILHISRYGIDTVGAEELESAISAFQRARLARTATLDMYNEIFDKLADEGLFEKTANLLDKQLFNITTSRYKDAECIDLDKFSYGISIFLLERHINSNPSTMTFSLRLKDGQEKLKEYACKECIDWDCTIDPDNTSIVLFKKKLTPQEQSCIAVTERFFKKQDQVTKEQSFPATQSAAKIKEFSRALHFLEQGFGTCKPDTFAVNLLMSKKLPSKNLAPKMALLAHAEKNGLTNNKTYRSLMGAAEDVENFPAVEWAFQKAKENKHADEKTYTVFIAVAGRLGQCERVHQVFNEAIKNAVATTAVYNATIIGLGEKNLEEATKIFDQMKFARMCNSSSYIAMMEILKKHNQLLALNTLVNQAIGAKICDDSLLTSFIELAGSSDELFKEAKNLFWKLQKRSPQAYHAFMKVLIAKGMHSEVEPVFKEMEKIVGLTDRAFYLLAESYYSHGKENVLKVYKQLKVSSYNRPPHNCTPQMYNLLINETTGMHQNVTLKLSKSTEIFQIEHNRKLLNASNYIFMMNLAFNVGKTEEAITFFDKSKEVSMNSKRVYNVFIDGLVKNNRYEKARETYDEAGLAIDFTLRKGVPLANLQGFSYGAAVIALEKYIQNSPKTSFNVSLGNVEKHGTSYRAREMRNYAKSISSYFQHWNWTCQNDSHDEDILVMQRKT